MLHYCNRSDFEMVEDLPPQENQSAEVRQRLAETRDNCCGCLSFSGFWVHYRIISEWVAIFDHDSGRLQSLWSQIRLLRRRSCKPRRFWGALCLRELACNELDWITIFWKCFNFIFRQSRHLKKKQNVTKANAPTNVPRLRWSRRICSP